MWSGKCEETHDGRKCEEPIGFLEHDNADGVATVTFVPYSVVQKFWRWDGKIIPVCMDCATGYYC